MQRTSLLFSLALLLCACAAHAQQSLALAAPTAAAQPGKGQAAGDAARAAVAQSAPARPPSSLVSSVITVEELIKVENANALESARQARIASGMAAPEAGSKAGPVAPRPLVVNVETIYGVPGALRAHLSSNGRTYEGVSNGSKIQSCEIESIAGRCVVLKPAVGAKVAPNMCPTSCWTGVLPGPTPQALAAAAGGPLPPPGVPPRPPITASGTPPLPAQ